MNTSTQNNTDAKTGTITSITNCGTIIIVTLASNGSFIPVYFDHRQFGWLLEGEQCGPGDLIGREANYDGEPLSLID
jgi:hypothetical protein